MKVSSVRITRKDEERLKAYADVTLDGALVIRGIKVIGGTGCCTVHMPSRRGADGTYRDVVSVTDRELAAAVSAAVLDAYGSGSGRDTPERDDRETRS